MAKPFDESSCVILHGFDPNTSRHEIFEELSTYGDICKLYIPLENDFAKIYYNSPQQAKTAVRHFFKKRPDWQLELFETYNTAQNMDYCKGEIENLVLNSDYVDIHGRSLGVLESPQGDIFISLKDIRKTEFAIFRREHFDPTLKNTSQIVKEFEMHMLSEAKKFLIGQEQIIETIKNCEEMLLGTTISTRDSFAKVNPSANDNGNVLRSKPTFSKSRNGNTSESSFESTGPKKLPTNFGPTNQTVRMVTEQRSRKSLQNTAGNPMKFPRSNDSDFREDFGPVKGGPMRPPKPILSENSSKFDETSSFKSEKMDKSSHLPRQKFFLGDYIKQIELPLHTPVQLKITIIQIGLQKAYATLADNEEIQRDILLKIKEEADNMPVIKDPKVGTLGIAKYEDDWYRAIVRDTNPLKVFYTDYGNVEEVSCIKEQPDSVKNIAAQVIRISQCLQGTSTQWQQDAVITVQAKKKYDDGTYIVTSSKVQPKPEKAAPEPEVKKAEEICHFTIPEPLTKIDNGVQVMILDCDDNTFILRTKELKERFDEITQIIKNLNKSDLNLQTVKKGQMVLCGKEDCAGLFRAKVTEVNLSIISVKYIDLTGNNSISLKALRNVNSVVAQFPATLIKSPAFPDLANYLENQKCKDFIEELIVGKIKLTVSLNDGFDLVLNNGKKLSTVFDDLANTPKPVVKEKPKLVEKTEVAEVTVPENRKQEVIEKPAEEAKSLGPVTYDDMGFTKLEIGTKDQFLSFSVEALDQLTIIPMSGKELEWFNYLLYLDVKDKEPYSPDLWEMCLALFTDKVWYRGVVLNKENNKFSVLFVDYGNTEILTATELRKYPDNLKNIPILGIMCELVGIPEGIPHKEEIFKRIKDTVTQEQKITVHVKSYDKDNFKYQVELPEEYEKLKSDGLF